MPDLLTDIETRFIVADLAVDRALSADACSEHLCLTAPDRVRTAHAAAITAGAALIRTNTLAANAAALATDGLADHTNEINWTAVQLARQAATGSAVWVAGRVGPLADSVPTEERSALYRQQIGALLDAKVDLICLEGFTNPGDLAAAVEIKHELHHLPVLASLAVTTNLDSAIQKLHHAEADILSFDSLSLEQVLTAMELVKTDLPLAGFPAAPQLSAEELSALEASGCRLIGTN